MIKMLAWHMRSHQIESFFIPDFFHLCFSANTSLPYHAQPHAPSPTVPCHALYTHLSVAFVHLSVPLHTLLHAPLHIHISTFHCAPICTTLHGYPSTSICAHLCIFLNIPLHPSCFLEAFRLVDDSHYAQSDYWYLTD